MKKSLLALAVLGAFAGAANAQTNVTIYGLVDAGLTREAGGAAGSVWKLATGVQSGNRLGFKGTEDLGGGLKANFQLENGFDLDTGAIRQGGALFGRQAWVGLSGNFGAVNLGRQYNPLFIALDSIDPFGTGLPGATTNLMNPSAVRTNNAITYSAPSISGFSANALYGLGEVAGSNDRARTYGLSLGYANGPISAVLAYDNANNGTVTTPVTNTTKLTLVGGTFNFGMATAHLGFETEKNDAGMKNRDWMVGVSAPVGAGTVMASYINKTDRIGNVDAKQYAIGYTHNLSKRTNLYTSYARINNDAGASFVVSDASSGGAGSVPTAGNSSSAFTVGVRHKF